MTYTNRHRMTTLEDVLKIRTKYVGDFNGEKRFKVWRMENNSYIFDGVYSKNDLITEANQK